LVAVSNSAGLIALVEIGRADILEALFDRLLVPGAVKRECLSGIGPCDVVEVEVENLALVAALNLQVDVGESEAIALAVENPGCVLILDDKKARRVAFAMGVQVVGTVGLLLRAKQAGIVSSVNTVLDELLDAGFRISTSLREEALKLAGEA
jgi:predicted nucleic acid-binding protein